MGQFLNPFTGMTPDRIMTNRELTRALRMALAAEEEAVHHYEALVDATDDKLAKEILQSISNEEKVHVGELQTLLNKLSEKESEFLKDGEKEVEDEVKKMATKSEGILSFSEYLKKD